MPAGGIAGGAVDSTGANADSFIVATTAVSAAPFTISFWMQTTSTQNDGLAYLGNRATGNQYNVNRMQGNVARANGRNTAEIQGAGTTPLNDGSWHHIVGVYGADDNRQIFVSGSIRSRWPIPAQ
ncbi:MAG: LamG-like jellyroll fold domain-containing protein [Verrucomicrobiales bacterium]